MKEADIIKSKVDVFSQVLQSLPDITYVGDTILRTPTEEVSLKEGIEIGKRLGRTIIEYRRIAGYGRGFAAPQIGLSKSVFATYVNEEVQIFINPKIIKASKTKNYYKELCLSSGILAADVARPEWITMQWFDEKGNRRQEKIDGFAARLYQHEEGHLRGEVNVDICEPNGIEICTFDPLQEKLRKTR